MQAETAAPAGLTVDPVELEAQVAKFDLSAVFAETGPPAEAPGTGPAGAPSTGPAGAGRGATLALTLEYDADLFDQETVERLGRRIEALLERVAAAPGTRLSGLPVLLEDERRQVLGAWRGTATGYPREASVVDLFRRQVAERPDAVALDFRPEGRDLQITYAALSARADALAGRLWAAGVRPGAPVGLCFERSPELVVAMLGTVLVGAAYVPLDPSYPPDRLALMLDDTGARVVLAGDGLEGALPRPLPDGVRVLGGGASPGAAAPSEVKAAPRVEVMPEQRLYVLYTSGSTGRPKGVVVPHRAVVRLVHDTDYVHLDPGDAVAHLSNTAFDAATFEVWGTLINGGRMVGIDRRSVLDPELFAGALDRGRVRALLMTAALFNQAAERIVAQPDGPVAAALAGVGTLVVGGEALDPGAIYGVMAAGRAPARLLNGYGPTENTTLSTTYEIPSSTGPAAIPIGWAIANSTTVVVDCHLQPVPPGVVGELLVGGDGLAQGYLGRPGLTAERFVPDLLSGRAGAGPGERLYRTGDLVRRLRSGEIVFIGRLDDQVKIRGFRIEPGEVAAVLSGHPALARVAVVVREDEPGELRLVAYVAPRADEGSPGRSPSGARDEASLVQALGEHLRERLPAYMVPSAFVVLDELPLTPNGKVDRRALPAPERPATAAYVAPRSATEELLARAFAQVLGTDGPVGVHDSFFDLGGHSLKATRLVAHLREVLDWEVPLRLVFEHPTVAALAAALPALRSGAAGAPIERLAAGAERPLSFAQERLWFLDQMAPESSAYNIVDALRLRGRLDVAALARAWNALVARHEPLRTVFEATGGRPVQRVLPRRRQPLPVIDLAALPAARREAVGRTLLEAEAERPFDLATGPLLVTPVVRLGTEEHLLLVSIHHIVADGWSMGVLVEEMAELYGAFREGRAPALRPLPIQFADYAVWERRRLSGAHLEWLLAAWHVRLDGLRPLALPTDRRRPAERGGAAGVVRLALPPAVRAGVAELAREHGATDFMVLLAAFQAFLSRLTGDDDVAVASPVANRERGEVHGLIGFFVNTLVLRGDLAGDPSFAELVARTRGRTLEAYAHQELPFERLVEELAPERDTGRPPLAQVMMTLQNAAEPVPLLGLEVGRLGIDPATSKVDLTASFSEAGDRFGLALEYDADLFDRETVEILGERLRTLLEQVVAAPERRLAELSLVTGPERRRLLGPWRGRAVDYPRDGSAVELFERRAAAHPDRVALDFGSVGGGSQVTYGALADRARALSGALRRQGVGPGDRVGLCFERSVELLVAILGVARLGAAYVPLDPANPAARLAYIIEDTGLRLILLGTGTRPGSGPEPGPESGPEPDPASGPGLGGALPDPLPPGVRVLGPAAQAEAIAARTEEAKAAAGDDRSVPAEQPLNVFYTSGSTGRPKGVEVPHRAVVRLACDTALVDFGAEDSVGHLSNTAFDAASLEIWGALLNGARLVGIDRDTVLDPATLFGDLSRRGVTAMFLTTALFNQVIAQVAAAGDRETVRPARPHTGLREIFFGGEAADPRTVRTARALLPSVLVVNVYGPTENGSISTRHRVRELPADATAVPIGGSLDNSTVQVVDRSLRLVPPGVDGELLVGGDGLAQGYLGRAALTAERFVPDPFAVLEGGRLYRTGDLARWRRDGALDFVGRVDDQVKIRGFRIEPGEVAAVLSGDPTLAAAAVIVREERPGELVLVAYAVPREGVDVQAGDLERSLRERLPGYMVPSAFVLLDELPVTPNGKLDRRALPAPERRAESGTGGLPRTEAEALVARAFSEVLGVERVGIDDSFFDLGGHSLKATQLASRLRELCRREVPVRLIFEAPTVAALAALLAEGDAELAAPPLVVRQTGGLRPLSFSQERLWILDRLDPGSAAYTIPAAVRLCGVLDLPALAVALGGVVARHEALRTTFVVRNGQPYQRVGPPAAQPLPAVDLAGLAGLPEARRGAALDAVLKQLCAAPFDLEEGPLLRTTLVVEAADRAVLHTTMHHIVSDGWSLGIFVREVCALYDAARTAGDGAGAGEGIAAEEPLAPLPIQYGDYAQWQRDWLSGETRERQLAHWRERLAGAPAGLDLPFDRPRPAVQTFRGDHREARLPAALTRGLRALGVEEDGSLFMVLLAAFKVLLARTSGEDDVVVGTPIAGRNRGELEGMIGMFLNTLVLRTDLAGAPSFRELVDRVRQTALDAYAHQDVPFEMLIDELGAERDPSRTPFFQVFFNMLELPFEARSRLPDVAVETVELPEEPSKFDLTLYVGPTGDGELSLSAAYNRDLFDGATVERLLGQYRALLEQVVANPEVPIEALSLVSAEERAVLPDPTAPLGAAWHGPIHGALHRIADEAPDRRAVVDAWGTWTYGGLRAWSDEVARRLTAAVLPAAAPAAGATGRTFRVAVYGERSAALAASVLGTLEAGGAFVMLDPAYPVQRLAETLAAAGVAALLHLEAAGEMPAALTEALAAAGTPVLAVGPRPDASPAGAPAPTASAAPAEPFEPVEAGPDDPAYVAFTSGSTGRPKGIVGRHGSLTHFLPWQCERFRLGPDDRFTMLSGLAHDPLHRDLFTPLWLGATLVAPDPRDLGTPERLRRWMAREGVTVAHLTPAMGKLLTERLPSRQTANPAHPVDPAAPAAPAAPADGAVPSLRRTFLVGDVLTRGDVARLRALSPSVGVVNLYGSTETQRAVAFHEVGAPSRGARGQEVLPLGRGMEDVQLLVLGRSGALAAIGEVGEIAVRSPHLALGYAEDEELTARRFAPNPFVPPGEAARSGDRIYRTGDLGRYDRAGEVRFLGRADQQVKIRGFRIELGEVVAHLEAAPGVEDAAVLLRSDGPLGQRLCAYVVAAARPEGRAAGGGEDDEARIAPVRDHLRERLPAYMVPATYVLLDRLPLTPNGKLDRRALQALDDRARDRGDRLREPSTEAERWVATAFREVLGVDEVGIDDNFFDLGGHSLKATQLVSRLRELCRQEVPLRQVFERPTVAELAAVLAAGDADLAAPTLVRRKATGPRPLSYAQERLWILDRLEPGSTAYNMPTAVRLTGRLDLAALTGAIDGMVARHESLRTTFAVRDGKPVQRVAPPGPQPLPAIDLSGLTGARRGPALDSVLAQLGACPFDLERGPLLRTTLVIEAADRAVLHSTMHHIVSDGWSMGIFVGEVCALYAARPLPPLPIQYGDYAVWQRQWLSGGTRERQLAHWRERLAGAPPGLDLPLDRPRPAVRTFRGAHQDFRLAPKLVAGLRALGARAGGSLFMVLLAAFKVLLARTSGEDDVVVGTPIAGRTRAELEGLIGMFLNTLVLRTDLSGSPSFGELVDRVRRTALDAFSHQDVPFEMLIDELRPERDLSRTPFFQIFFNMLELPFEARAELPGLEVGAVDMPEDPPKFDLTLYLRPDADDGVVLAAVYNKDLFDPVTMERLLSQYRLLLEQAVARPEAPIGSLSLLSAEERAVLPDPTAPLDATWHGPIHAALAADRGRGAGPAGGRRRPGDLELRRAPRLVGRGGAPSAAAPGGALAGPGRHLRPARGLPGAGRARHAGGGRRVRHARPDLSGAAPGRHARGGRGRRAAPPGGGRGDAGGAGRGAGGGRDAGAGGGAAARRFAGRADRVRRSGHPGRAVRAGRGRSGRPGLRRLHLGLDRAAERDRRAPRLVDPFPALAVPALRARAGRPVHHALRSGPRPAAARPVHPALARRDPGGSGSAGPGDAGAAAALDGPRGRHGRPPDAGHGEAADRPAAVRTAGRPGGGRGRRCRAVAPPDLPGGRRADPGRRGAAAGALAAGRRGQPLRLDRDPAGGGLPRGRRGGRGPRR